MPGLSPAFSLARRGRRLSLHAHRIRRRRFGGVGGIQFQSGFQVLDSRFEIGDPLLHGEEHGSNCRLGIGGDLAPEFIWNRQRIGHGDDVSPLPNFVNTRV